MSDKSAPDFAMAVPSIHDAAEDWWRKKGRFFDPDTDDVPAEDKLRAIQESAFVSGARHLYEAYIIANPKQHFADRLLAAPPRDGVCVAGGVWGDKDSWPLEIRAYLYDSLHNVASNRLRPLDGHRVRLWVEDLGGAK